MAALFKHALKQPPVRHRLCGRGSRSCCSLVSIQVPEGVDPKTIMCVFFKQNICLKGRKCKFSHNRNATKKKKDLHADEREKKQRGRLRCCNPARAAILTCMIARAHQPTRWTSGTRVSWKKSSTPMHRKPIRTARLTLYVGCGTADSIASTLTAPRCRQVCKHFLDAIEKELYGWFWVCPNGGANCMYRHALPPGYVFKTKRERELEKLLEANKENAASIEQIIEEEVCWECVCYPASCMLNLGGVFPACATAVDWADACHTRDFHEVERGPSQAPGRHAGS